METTPEMNQAQREKLWDELTLAEQVERMRGIVKNLQRDVGELAVRIQQLSSHDHSSGRVVVGIFSLGMEATAVKPWGTPDGVWF